jgi:uncharacterized protein
MLNSEVREKAEYFSRSVRRRLGSNVIGVILFGSRARGDYWQGSDYDFIVIVDHKDREIEKMVSAAGNDFLNHYDELAAELVFDVVEWNRQKNFPLGINVEREGVAV